MACRLTLIVEMLSSYEILIGNLEWKMPLGRPRHRWKNNIEVNHTEVK
jgi:hypothetical protein